MRKIDFNKDWKYWKVGGEETVTAVTLPHDAMLSEKRVETSLGGTNTGWFEEHDYVYAKTFALPADYAGKKITFEFEGVYQNAEVYINGEKAGYRPYGYTNFYVDASDFLNCGGENEIKVLAKNAEQPNSRWYSGAGIYRPVYMYVADDKHIKMNGVKVRTLSIDPAVIEVTVLTEGTGKTDVDILFGGKKIASASAESDGRAKCEIAIENAKLWDCGNPNLYECAVSFCGDEECVNFGIRTISCDAKNGFRLNEKRVLLTGCCVHHDNGILGAIAHPYAEYRKVKLLKENGYNSIRSAHNPCSKAMLDACDALGILMIDEFVDMWYIHKTKYDYAGYFDDWWRTDVADLIDKNYNHPCVIMYSMGNEVGETAQERGIALSEEMTKFCHELDSTRFVTCGVNLFFNYLSSMGFGIYTDKKADKAAESPKKVKKNAVGSEFFNNLAGILGSGFMKWGATLSGSNKHTKRAFAKFDAAGYNYGVGRYKKDAKKHPGRVIIGSETFVSDAYKFYEQAKKSPALIGDFVWTGIDYLGEVGLGSWEYLNYVPDFSHGAGWIAAGSGRLDITGKPGGEMAYTRVAYELDAIRIAVVPVDTATQVHSPASWRMTNAQETWSWNGCDGKETKVEVYVRAYKAELFINGKSVGTKKLKNDCRAVFKVKYESGEVTAVGYDRSGKEIARTSLKTASDETKLAIFPEAETLGADDLCYVRLMYTDNAGNLKPLARGDIKLIVSGGRLLALGNGCSYNERGYLTDTTDTYYGEALAIIAPEKGSVKICAESELGNAQAEIKCK